MKKNTPKITIAYLKDIPLETICERHILSFSDGKRKPSKTILMHKYQYLLHVIITRCKQSDEGHCHLNAQFYRDHIFHDHWNDMLLNLSYLGIINIGTYSVGKHSTTITLMKWKYLFGALMLLPISAREFILTQWGAVPSTAWFAIAFVIFFSTFFSYFLVPFGQKYLQPTTVAMYNYLQPVTASLIAVASSQETFGPVKALAMLLVFLGVWFVSTSGQRKTGVAIFSLRKDRN